MDLMNISERIDSLKAGILGAITVGFTLILTLIFHALIFSKWSKDQMILSLITPDIKTLISMGMIMFSGFLFGVTYRYIMREDENFHLQSGAIIAFGLVRSLGQMEIGFNILSPDLSPTFLVSSGGQWLILILENLLLFGVAAMSLDQGIQRGWIKSITHHQ